MSRPWIAIGADEEYYCISVNTPHPWYRSEEGKRKDRKQDNDDIDLAPLLLADS